MHAEKSTVGPDSVQQASTAARSGREGMLQMEARDEDSSKQAGLVKLIQNSPQVAQLATYQELADGYVHSKSLPMGKGIVQRKLTIGKKVQTAQEVVEESDFVTPSDKTAATQILEVWDAMDRSFESLKALAVAVNKVLPFYKGITNIAVFPNLSAYIQAQVATQTYVSKNAADFAGLFTTAGFEHEFMQMKTGPLRGITHLTLARSAVAMPLTGIGFNLETDADNALELVFPPLLVPTVMGTTLPNPGFLVALDELIKASLTGLVQKLSKDANKNQRWYQETLNATMADLFTGLSTVLGVKISPVEGLRVGAENMTHNTEPSLLAAPDVPEDVLGAIQIGQSQKHSSGIDSQVNVAMDMRTASLLDEASEVSQDRNFPAIITKVGTEVEKLLPLPSVASPSLARFYTLMWQKLTSLVAVGPSRQVQAYQQHQLGRIGEPVVDYSNPDTVTAEQREAYLEEARLADRNRSVALTSSLVKDTRTIWVKDHLTSLLEGLLDESDKMVLLAQLVERRHAAIPASGYDEFNAQLLSALETLIAHLGGSQKLANEPPGVSFLSHNPKFIGARQDTYLNPAQVQLPGLWKDRRLHVVEIRKSNLQIFADAYKKLTGKSVSISTFNGSSGKGLSSIVVKAPLEGTEEWAAFQEAMLAENIVPLDVQDAPDIHNLHIGVDSQVESEIDRKKDADKKVASSDSVRVVVSSGSTSSSEPSGQPKDQVVVLEPSDQLPDEPSVSRSPDTVSDQGHAKDHVSSHPSPKPKEEPPVPKKEEPPKKEEASDPKKKKEAFTRADLVLVPNPGGGDCLYHGLAGRTLVGIGLTAARDLVADVRRDMVAEHTGNNANQVALALYQSGISLQAVRELTLGRHDVSNVTYSLLQRVPGMYAGEEELIQWCQHHGRRVAVVYQNGEVARFTAAGRAAIPIDPLNRYAETLQELQAAYCCLYKTPNHWERITTYRGTALNNPIDALVDGEG